MAYLGIDAILKPSAAVAGTGSAVNGDWVNVGDFLAGLLFIDVTAIDSATTIAFTVDFANQDKTIVGASGVSISNMTTATQQMVAFSVLSTWVRLNWTVTNAKNATFRAVLNGKMQTV